MEEKIKAKYRIHFKSGLHIDVEEVTDKKYFTDVWKSLLDIQKTSQGRYWASRIGKNKTYVFDVGEIVCFETLP